MQKFLFKNKQLTKAKFENHFHKIKNKKTKKIYVSFYMAVLRFCLRDGVRVATPATQNGRRVIINGTGNCGAGCAGSNPPASCVVVDLTTVPLNRLLRVLNNTARMATPSSVSVEATASTQWLANIISALRPDLIGQGDQEPAE